MPALIPFAIAFLAVGGITPLVRHLALRANFVDRPSARRFHEKVTALGGGLAIVIGVMLAVLLGGLAIAPPRWLATLIAGTALLACLGVVDDRRGLSPIVKLGGQIVAALLLVYGAGVTHMELLGVWTVPLAIIWVVGLLNACNFLDNMDGILAGIAALCAIGFWGIGAGGEAADIVVLAAAVAGGSLGFLIYNFPPASIFMGDAGSMVLGFWLAALSLSVLPVERSARSWSLLIAVVLVVAYPVFDICFVTLTRLYERRKVYLGGRDHSSHRLNNVLESPRLTALTIYCLTAVVAALGVSVGRQPTLERAIVLGGCAAVLLLALGLRLARLPIR